LTGSSRLGYAQSTWPGVVRSDFGVERTSLMNPNTLLTWLVGLIVLVLLLAGL